MRFIWADESHFSDVFSLWQQGFPADSADDIRAFWNALKHEARCLMLFEEEEARSMAFVIPAALGDKSLWYVYAAATAVEYRGKGLFRLLMDELYRCAEQAQVDGLFLRPGEPTLFHYYARLGFQSAFYTDTFVCKAEEHYTEGEVAWRAVTSDFAQHRADHLARLGVPSIRWSNAVTEYAVSLLENGGMLLSEIGLAMYRYESDELVITELLCDTACAENALQSLLRYFACRQAVVSRPAAHKRVECEYGMFRAIGASDCVNDAWYMGFSLE